ECVKSVKQCKGSKPSLDPDQGQTWLKHAWVLGNNSSMYKIEPNLARSGPIWVLSIA
ncbi:hypothetical protein Ancab_039352, partial [Ancistrocladus abbreviatus]